MVTVWTAHFNCPAYIRREAQTLTFGASATFTPLPPFYTLRKLQHKEKGDLDTPPSIAPAALTVSGAGRKMKPTMKALQAELAPTGV